MRMQCFNTNKESNPAESSEQRFSKTTWRAVACCSCALFIARPSTGYLTKSKRNILHKRASALAQKHCAISLPLCATRSHTSHLARGKHSKNISMTVPQGSTHPRAENQRDKQE